MSGLSAFRAGPADAARNSLRNKFPYGAPYGLFKLTLKGAKPITTLKLTEKLSCAKANRAAAPSACDFVKRNTVIVRAGKRYTARAKHRWSQIAASSAASDATTVCLTDC